MGNILIMQINSVWHITLSGRSLRIDSFSKKYSVRDAVVFTKKVDSGSFIKEKTRILSFEIAKMMRLRKYLELTEKTSITAGSFVIKIEEISDDRKNCNILINDKLYFMSFLPYLIKMLPSDLTLLIPADSNYYEKTDLEKIEKYLSISKPKNIVMSGDYSIQWHAVLSRKYHIKLLNEMVQQDIFR